jgi:Co/Zn/Cd efflux system component
MKSPSAPIMWGLLLGLFLALEAIIDEMIIISFVGVTANLIGAVLFKIADKNCIKEE